MNKGYILFMLLLSMFVIGLAGFIISGHFDGSSDIRKMQKEIISSMKIRDFNRIEKTIAEEKKKTDYKQLMDWLLLYSVYLNDTEFVRFFLSKGADPNYYHFYFGSKCATPLMLSADLGYKKMVKILLENNVNLSADNGFGQNALIEAVTPYYENTMFYEQLDAISGNKVLKKDSGLSKAKYHEQLDIIKILTEKDKNLLKKKDRKGKNALDYALAENDKDIINYLQSLN
jgi:Ankyrin repeats (3 copies)